MLWPCGTMISYLTVATDFKVLLSEHLYCHERWHVVLHYAQGIMVCFGNDCNNSTIFDYKCLPYLASYCNSV